MTPTFLTVDEVAVLLRLTPKAVRHRIERGQIPVVRLGRSVRVRRDLLLSLLGETISGHVGK